MDNGFSILMLIFGAAILLYAAALSSGNENLLPYRALHSLRRTNRKEQVRHIAAVTAITALPITAGGAVGFFLGNLACLITMGVTAAIIITVAVILHKQKK